MKPHLSRHRFLTILSGLVTLPFFYLFGKGLHNGMKLAGKKTIKIQGPFPDGISFYDDFLMVKKGDSIEIFSNRCTHLGCSLRTAVNGIIRCPCHGSEYDTSGKAIKGPAYHDLPSLAFTLAHDTLTVTLT